MKIFPLIVFIHISLVSSSQTLKTFGSDGPDRGIDVIETSDSGFIVTGAVYRPDKNEDILLLKTDKSGNEVWQKSYGGKGSDNGWCVLELKDGYAIFGFTDSFGAGGLDAFLLKTNLKGDSLWMKTYGDNNDQLGWSIRSSSNGNFVALAQTSNESGPPDIWILGLDSNGNERWKTRIGKDNLSDRAFYIEETIDHNYVITGLSASKEKSNDDVFIAKVNDNGKLLWEKTLDFKSLELGHSIIDYKGSYFIFGYSISSKSSLHKPLLIKIKKNGKVGWKKLVEGIDGDVRILHGQVFQDGLIATGYQKKENKNYIEGVIIKFDTKGNIIWTRNFGDEGNAMGYTVRLLNDGKYVLTGNKMTKKNNSEILLIIDELK